MDLIQLTDQGSREALKRDLKIHLGRQTIEREDYYKKRNEALKSPTEILSVIVDGMGQAKTNDPHFRGWTRPKSAAPALKSHITGVHMHGQKSSFYIDMLQYPHDPNLTITCLLNAIYSGRDVLPPKLYIQCDNCGRENKNRHVIGFLAYMCLAGYVKEVRVGAYLARQCVQPQVKVVLSFLIKGHTNEDIDQLFSKVSHHLRGVNAMTIPQMKKKVENSFQTRPYVEMLGCVWDSKSWFDDSMNEMSNHSYQHQFWVYCDRPHHVALKYRRFSCDSWLPAQEDDQLELFVLDTFGEQQFPRGTPGTPKICVSKYAADRIDSVKLAIHKMKNFLKHDEYEWWLDF